MIFYNEFMHLRYCARILNLIVSDGLKEIDDLVTKVRNAVKYMKSYSISSSHPLRGKIFLVVVFFYLDVPTQWKSTY